MSLNNKKNNKNKGSVLFVFYFILGVALLTVAGYYIGINEQKNLFNSIAKQKQQQLDGTSTAEFVDLNNNSNLAGKQDVPMKSLIDSPAIVLRNIRNANIANQGSDSGVNNSDGESGGSIVKIAFGPNVDPNSDEANKMVNFAKLSNYLIKTKENTDGVDIKLLNGKAVGDSCYNDQTGRVCFPQYSLDKIWSIGDLNGDKVNDSIISVSAIENLATDKLKTDNFYALITATTSVAKSATSAVKATTSAVKATSGVVKSATSSAVKSKSSTDKSVIKATTTAATTTVATTTTSVLEDKSYNIVPFNFGLYSPTILSAEISDRSAVLIGNFYANGDFLGKPSANKVIKYKLANNLMQKVSEAKLFKEQGEKTSTWYPYNYTFSSLDFSFRVPETWQKEELFENGTVNITFKTSDNRSLVLQTKSIVETCSEYNFNLNDSTNVKVKDSEFIDLGLFGVGSYIKYGIMGADTNQYHADICVTDKNNDKEIFSLYSNAKEDGDPYFSIFDKIWSTFKVKQNSSSY